MSVFCGPFTTADIRYFDINDRGQAAAWVAEGLDTAAVDEVG